MKAKKRFQSGAEIFDTYVPNFERQDADAQSEFVEEVLAEFRRNISKTVKKAKAKKPGTVARKR